MHLRVEGIVTKKSSSVY